MKRVYHLTHVTITVDDDAKYVGTRFLADGAECGATTEAHYAEVDHAQRLGYADTWERCWTHELAHSWLAEKRGYRWSITLRAVADGVHREQAKEINREESAVEGLEAIRHLVPEFQAFLANYEVLEAAA